MKILNRKKFPFSFVKREFLLILQPYYIHGMPERKNDTDIKLFANYLGERREEIWKYIESCLAEYKQTDKEILRMMGQSMYDGLLEEHWSIVEDYPRRKGKYLRPGLVLLMAEALGVKKEKALCTAAAMQTSEDWILVHDDLVDRSLERRGEKALHRIVGEEIAVNAGDTLHECMHRILNRNYGILDTALASRVQQEFFRMLSRTCFGQYAEIKWMQEDRQDMTEADVIFTISGKTVYYTIAGPLRLGAILAGASDEQLHKIYEFSYPLGLCFQIRDDVLDLTSDFEGLKKQVCNDIYEGKRTLILLHLLRTAKGEELEKIQSILAKPRELKTLDEVLYIKKKMLDHGSISYADGLAEKYAAEAMAKLDNIDFIWDGKFKELFRSMVEFILKRGK